MVIQTTGEPEKMAKVLIALISVTVVVMAVCGGIIDVHQHGVEEKAGLWKPLIPLMKDDSMPVIFNPQIAPYGAEVCSFSSPPP